MAVNFKDQQYSFNRQPPNRKKMFYFRNIHN